MTPDAIVDELGRQVTHEYVETAAYDDFDELDEGASTITQDTIQAISSQPSEEDRVRLEGRAASASLRLTVKSDVDIQADREGRPDRIIDGGRTYEVVEVVDSTHPFVDVSKQQVYLEELPGR